MKQKLLTFLLLIACVGNAWGIRYKVNTTAGTAAVVSSSGSYSYADNQPYSGDVVIPQEIVYNGVTYPVTSIDFDAFYNCSGLTTITIPKSVTSIGLEAFKGCSRLTSITIPASVTSIDSYAFCNCSSLTSITIPESVTSIGSCAFEGCSRLTSITIPESVTSIDYHLFYGCTGLTSITIPASVTSIGSEAFKSCSNIASLTWGSRISHHEVTQYCREKLKKVTLLDGVTRIGDYDFQGYTGLTSITIPASVTSIGSNAFSGCSRLTSITIPASVTSIGSYAFSSCSSLTSITIPESVTSIAIDAFWRCSGLTSITIPESVTSIGISAFSDCPKLTSITIPSSVTSVGDYAFYNCSSLTDVTSLAMTPPSIYSNTFSTYGTLHVLPGCGDAYRAADYWKNFTIVEDAEGPIVKGTCGELLTWSLNVETGVLNIEGTGAMYDYSINSQLGSPAPWTSYQSYVRQVIIASGVTSIGNWAFSDRSPYTSLTSVSIPESVTSIGEGAFYNCTSLTSITIPESVTSIGPDAFYGTDWYNSQLDGLVYAGLVAYKYKGTMPANTGIVIKDGTKGIAGSAFNYCTSLTSITIPESVTNIGNYAFLDCRSLTSITIPESVTNIGFEAFLGCSSLTDVTSLAMTPPSCSSSTFSTYGTLHVLPGCGDAYRAADYWKNFTIVEDAVDPNTQITLSSTAFTLVAGETMTLTATVTPAAAVTWSSNNTSVATVDQTGMVTACGVGSATITVTADGSGKSASCTVTVSKNVYTIVDKADYTGTKDIAYDEITYTRTFSEKPVNTWQPLYLPISINVEDYKDEFDVAQIFAFSPYRDTNGNGVLDADDENYLFVTFVTSGSTKANLPYVIRPKHSGNFTMKSSDGILHAAKNGVVTLATANNVFTFTGTSTRFNLSANDGNYYVDSYGRLSWAVTDDYVTANRWVMHKESIEYGGSIAPTNNSVKEYKILTIGEDIDEETAIQLIKEGTEATAPTDNRIYTIDGKEVTNTQHLPAGLYIKNGKKFVVK